ncbi:hypothetical protein ABCR94_33360 [Streptomyces sp. 21So2-11]|uniref:hypothetical protein n=1 Tax=Streptomyces sp. 21So2-11 TaxID=3144408 RepID=UPI00321AF69F
MRSVLCVLAAGAIILGGASAASADVTVNTGDPSYTIVFGDWLQFAGDDLFNAGHDNTVGSFKH